MAKNRDGKYLSFIRLKPCCICGNDQNVQAHHTETGGMGYKGSDYSCVPLCYYCHNKIHNEYGKRSYWDEKQLKLMIEEYQRKYMKRGQNAKN